MRYKHYVRDEWSECDIASGDRAERWARRGLVIIAMFVLCAWACGAYAQTAPFFTATVTKGISPVATKFTWTCPQGSVSATASSTGNQSAWTGSKALSGTQNLSGIKLSADYKLDCVTAAGTATATLTWAAPTQNTDGSALTNLAGFKLYYGTSSTNLINSTSVGAGVTSSVINSLSAGTWYFAVTAYNDQGIESAYSNVASKSVTVSAPVTYSNTVTITVQTQPAPPTLLTVDTTAYEINKSTDALQLAAVGTVPLGVSCKPQYDANGMNVVPRDQVKFKSSTRPLVVVAKCG